MLDCSVPAMEEAKIKSRMRFCTEEELQPVEHQGALNARLLQGALNAQLLQGAPLQLRAKLETTQTNSFSLNNRKQNHFKLYKLFSNILFTSPKPIDLTYTTIHI